MSTLDPALDAELKKPIVTMVGILKIDWPGYGLHLCDGAGIVSFNGDSYSGRDATYGTIESIEKFSDGVDTEAPTLSLTLLPASNVATAVLTNPAKQGCSVYLWVGAVNVRTGRLVSTPTLRFLGAVDVTTIVVGQNSRRLKVDVVSAFEGFFTDDEGVRLSDAWHQSIWQGETGLAGVNNVQRKLPWGGSAPAPASLAASAPAGAGARTTGAGLATR